MKRNPLAALADHLRNLRTIRIADTYGRRALIAYDRRDNAAYCTAMNTLAAHGHAAVYSAAVYWLHLVRRHARPEGPPDAQWALEVALLDPDSGEPVAQVDNPDTLNDPTHRAGLWAARMLAAVLNDDKKMCAALYWARANEGFPELALGMQAAATLTTNLLRDTPTGRDILRR